MGTFRPGKPWLQLLLDAPKSQTSGIHAISWDSAAGDGDWSSTILPTSQVRVEIPGLYWFGLNVARDSPGGSSNVTSRLEFDGQVIARTRGPSDATAYGTSCSMVAMVLTPGTIIEAFCQLSASLTVGFDEDATNLTLVRIGPVRWTG